MFLSFFEKILAPSLNERKKVHQFLETTICIIINLYYFHFQYVFICWYVDCDSRLNFSFYFSVSCAELYAATEQILSMFTSSITGVRIKPMII